MLQEVLTNQKLFETRQTRLEERLSKLESNASSSSSKSSSNEFPGKKKRVVTRALSVSTKTLLSFIRNLYLSLKMQVKVQSIHNSLDDSEQFLPEQRLFTQCYFFVHNDMLYDIVQLQFNISAQ